MNKIFLTLIAVAAASAAHAQSETAALSARSFESQAAQSISSFLPEDAFAGVGACGALDVKALRPWTLEEATEMADPCLKAVGLKYRAQLALQAGLISEGRAAKTGLLLKADVVPGSKAHRDLLDSLNIRHGEILGHQVRLLTRGQVAPAAVSAVQTALSSCMIATVVRDLRSSDDFVKVYGSCLTRDQDLKIAQIRAGEDQTVSVKTAQASAASLNGYVTVNAGKGPVRFMILASSL